MGGKCFWGDHARNCVSIWGRVVKILKRAQLPADRCYSAENPPALSRLVCSEADVSPHKTRRTVRNHNFTLPATGFIFLSCFHTIGSHQRELLFMIQKCTSVSISLRVEKKGDHAWFITCCIIDIHSQHGALGILIFIWIFENMLRKSFALPYALPPLEVVLFTGHMYCVVALPAS